VIVNANNPLQSLSLNDETTGDHPQPATTTRRRLVAAGGGLATVGLAGCMGALNSVAEAILKDVNVINGTDTERRGSITVTGPDGETVLDDSFTVAPQDSDSADGEQSSTPTFGDVFTGSGEYTVSVSLAADSAINGRTDGEETVTIDTPDDQHIIVGLGASDSQSPIEILVINEFSDLADEFNESAVSGEQS
jgi:hypothetical protein